MSPHSFARPGLRSLFVLVLLAGCSDPQDDSGGEPLTILARPAATDTVNARPTQALVVRVLTETGAPRIGALVRFAGIEDYTNVERNMWIRPLGGSEKVGQVAVPVDSRGQAAVQVEFGSTAGPGQIEVSVPEIGLSQQVEFTIVAGQVASIRAMPRDTAAPVGTPVAIVGKTLDRYGNPRTDAVTYSAISTPEGASTITSEGTVNASRPARVRVIATAGDRQDTVYLSLVPAGTFVGLSSRGLELSNLDGTGRQVLLSQVNVYLEPAWSPNGAEVAVTPGPVPRHVDFVGIGGPDSELSLPDGAADVYWPDYSPDGTYLYYTLVVGGYQVPGLARIRRDGSAPPEQLQQCTCYRPSVSPNGRYVTYHAPAPDGSIQVEVYDVVARQLALPPVRGFFPEWAPGSSTIAFLDAETAQIKLMEPGGAPRVLTPPGRFYIQGQLSWSGNNQWLLARSAASIDLIEAATGLILPLPWAGDWSQPAFKP